MAASSRAIVVKIDFTGEEMGQNVTVSYDGHSESGYAGVLDFSAYGGTNYNTLLGTFTSQCVDLNHDISIGTSFLVDPVSTNSGLLKGGSEAAYLWDRFGLGDYSSSDQVSTATQAAALQIAMWKTVVDGVNSTNLATGNFQYTTSGAVLTQATTYLTDAVDQSATAVWLDGSLGGTVTNQTGQNQIGYCSGLPVDSTDVPEGGTLALIVASGASGAGFIRARRRK